MNWLVKKVLKLTLIRTGLFLYSINLMFHFYRVQENLCLLEDGQLAMVPNISHRHDYISGKNHDKLVFLCHTLRFYL